MFFDSIVLSSQAIFPLGIAAVYVALCLYVLASRNPENAVDRLLLIYFLLTILWCLELAAKFSNLTWLLPLRSVTWEQLMTYNLIILGVTYWNLAYAFLQNSKKSTWSWGGGLVGLIFVAALDQGWLVLPPQIFIWSNHLVQAQNFSLILSMFFWGFFMSLAALTALVQNFQTSSLAHRNRIQYLFMSTILLIAGYGLYLSLPKPLWTIGMILIGAGGVLTSYTVMVEDLLNLGTGVRWIISTMVVVLITTLVYLAGIILVRATLGDFFAETPAGYFDQNLIVAIVTAVLLTIIYTPIRQISQYLTNRLLFGQYYNFQEVIQSYTQVVSNRVYLGELTNVAINHINKVLGLNRSALFILESETSTQLNLRTLPAAGANGVPHTILLEKDTPITHRLINERRPLSQYTIDISLQFKNAPENDRQALKALNYEWFIPILRNNQLIGIFALGAKNSGHPYSDQDMRLLTTFADQTSLALENATLFDGMQRNLEEMTRLKNLMGNVFDSMESGVITTDTLGKITLYNQAAASILAAPMDGGGIGKPYTEVLPALNGTVFPNLVTNVAQRESHYIDYEIVSELPGRGKITLSLNLAPLKDAQDQTQGVTIVVDDITETKQLRAVHDMFRRYVSPAVVDRLLANPVDLRLGGHRQEVSILFADIRGFTAFSERLTPEELVDTLNQYLSLAGSSILMYEGTLDKFVGDAVMAIFNAPLEQPDHVLRAIRAAVAIQQTIADYHKSIGEERKLTFGIGIHTGEVLVGNVGLSDRMDYTVIGDTVNLAKRLQENAAGGKILISETVYEIAKASIKANFYKEMRVKGRQQPVKSYELISI